MFAPKYGYKTSQECYLDRVNHRKEWYDLITKYNIHDMSRLCKLVLAKHDIYICRYVLELEASRELFLDRSAHLPP